MDRMPGARGRRIGGGRLWGWRGLLRLGRRVAHWETQKRENEDRCDQSHARSVANRQPTTRPLDIYPGRKARFVKNFMQGAASIQDALAAYVKAVKDKTFPAPEHTF